MCVLFKGGDQECVSYLKGGDQECVSYLKEEIRSVCPI